MRVFLAGTLLGLLLISCAANRQKEETQIQAMLASSAHYYAQKASAFASSGQHEEAAQHYRRAIELVPTEPSYYNNLGVAYFHLNRADSALWAYQSALRLRPDYGQVLVNMAHLYLQIGNINYAASAADAAIAAEPDLAGGYAVRAAVFDEQKLFDSAVEYYQRALKLAPDNPSYHINLGVLYYRKGLINEAIRQYKSAVEMDSSQVIAYFNLANAYARKCHLEEALEYYALALRYKPDFAAAINNSGLVLMNQGRYAEAAETMNQALDGQDNRSAIHFNLSIAYDHLDSLQLARRHIDAALLLRPDEPLYRVQQGNIYLRLEEREAAIAAFSRAVELDSSLVIGFNNLGNALLPERADEAELAYQKAMQLFPEYLERRYFAGERYLEDGITDLLGGCQSPSEVTRNYAKIYANLGNAYLRDGKLGQAAEMLEQALEIDPALIETWQSLAVVRQRQARPQAARQALARMHYHRAQEAAADSQWDLAADESQQAIALDSGFAAAFALLGQVWNSQGRARDAEAAFSQALGLAPEEPIVLLNYAIAQVEQERWQEAQPYFERALRHLPDSRPILERLVDLLEGQGRHQIASPYRARFLYLRGRELQFAGLWDQAADAFSEAVELQPQVAEYWAAQGYLYAKKHLNDEAEQVLQKALEIDPENSIALFALGLVYGDRQNFARAVEILEKVLSIRPDFGKAYYTLAVNHYFLQHYELAWNYLQKAQNLGEIVRRDFIDALNVVHPLPEQ
ncbi:tetratricopeptide repeat protein [candidate division KSB1 bacterium]|nr:tetratricopeptide repeat protein [candidate division KSB1 bacterium]